MNFRLVFLLVVSSARTLLGSDIKEDGASNVGEYLEVSSLSSSRPMLRRTTSSPVEAAEKDLYNDESIPEVRMCLQFLMLYF